MLDRSCLKSRKDSLKAHFREPVNFDKSLFCMVENQFNRRDLLIIEFLKKRAGRKKRFFIGFINFNFKETQKVMLQIGDNAPDFELASHLDKDRKVRLSELRGQNVVIAFYPLDWTPV
jgi:hypothetical protein